MKYRGTTVVWLVAIMLVVGLATTTSAATLYLGTSKSTVIPGETFTVDIVLDDFEGKVAACALTLTYPIDKVDAPAGDSEGAVQGITSVFFQNFQGRRMHRENVDSGAGKILFSGANIGNDGGPPYSSSDQRILFTIPFTVKNDPGLIGQSITFGLEQSQLLNTDAGWGDGTNPEPVPVLVGAVPNTDTQNWNDLTKAFPVLLSDTTDPPFMPFSSAAIPIEEFPTYVTDGTITYSGQQTGTLHVAAFETTDTTFSNPIGGKTYPWPQGTSSVEFVLSIKDGTYYLAAFIDSNGDSSLGASEAQGDYLTPIIISGDHDTTSRDFSLNDPDNDSNGLPDWWDNLYPGIGASGDDYEQDGYTNLVELQNMTNPTEQDDPYVLPGYDVSTDNRGPYQVVSLSPAAPPAVLGGALRLAVQYDVSDSDNTLTSLGVRVHFDSTKLNYTGFENFFETGKLADPQLQDDIADDDNDVNTDKLVLLSYSDPFAGNWPNQPLPLNLVDLLFTVDSAAELGTTQVNVTKVTGHTGYSFAGVGSAITVIPFNLDCDGNGQADGGTDGILFIRYLFEIRGDALIQNAVDTINCTRCTATEIETDLATATDMIDVDGNGQADGGTDGILLIRYLFEIRGDALIQNAVDTINCTRCTATEIEQYLDGLNP
jgi:hypothetical protein